ncbi:MAG: hypothetical protein RLZZ219_693 [Cyanobacteriota bacterium]
MARSIGRLAARLALLALLLVTAATPALAETAACEPISRAEVVALFERWNGALASGDPATVAALYSDDALLLPTLSSEPRSSPGAITDYFKGFLALAPRGRIDSRTIQLGCDSAVDAGTYSFTLNGAEPPGRVQARYTFVYARRDGEWRIVHHHSSLQPAA